MLTFLAYLVLGVFLIGFVARLLKYAKAISPLKIAVTPAPVTKMGVVWRMLIEVALFNSLFKGDKLAWAGGIAFHGALIVVLIRHIRYFVDPLPPFFAQVQIFGILAGLAMAGALGFLFLRRIVFERVRFISSLSDYLILLLLLGIACSGLLMDFFLRPNVVAIKSSMLGLFTSMTSLPAVNSPGDIVFVLHLVLVGILLIIFPYSKLMHAGGLFFSPTRVQVDNPRECKHVNPWAKP